MDFLSGIFFTMATMVIAIVGLVLVILTIFVIRDHRQEMTADKHEEEQEAKAKILNFPRDKAEK